MRGVGDAVFIQREMNLIDADACGARITIQIASHDLSAAPAMLSNSGKATVTRLR